ncbi:FadR family transcriptional regulator [Micrococcales bacterium 31B]|nr:FadR family transcriptional regulator [Micrococcales bacterium 31B]
MHKPRSLARSSLVSEVQLSIKELIFQQRLGSGDPLPTEHELAEELGVSRNSLREALKVLEATGVVNIKRGNGMFVGGMSLRGMIQELVFHARLSAATGSKELHDLVELREFLETSLMAPVSGACTPAHLDTLNGLVDEMERESHHGMPPAEIDRKFHEALYAPLGNPFISQLLAAFWEVLRTLDEHLPEGTETPTSIVEVHRAIVRGIESRDSVAAQAAMTTHFDGIKRRLQRIDAANLD